MPKYKSTWINETKLNKLRNEHHSKLIRECKHRVDLFKNSLCVRSGNTINNELIYLHYNKNKPYKESLTPFLHQDTQEENNENKN